LRHVNSPPPPPPPPQSSGLSLPGSANGTPYLAREKPSSTYYDPTLDQGDASSSWQHSHYSRQPTFVPPHPPHVCTSDPNILWCWLTLTISFRSG
jgi:hypothetical protein